MIALSDQGQWYVMTFDEEYKIGLKNKVICVVGPTASGKTELAQNIALHYQGEVLSADSMQIYRGMDIGTGKLSASEQKVPHWGLDIVAPNEAYSAALFQTYARDCMRDIDKRGKRTVLCGGTGFYVRAALDDYDFPRGDQTNNPTRTYYEDYVSKHSNQELWDILHQKDAQSAESIHPNNVKRVIRALEMYDEGVSYATQKAQLAHIAQVVPAVFIGLEVDPQTLNERIDKRVDHMIDSGLIDEVTTLLAQGFRESITSPQAIGYKEIVRVIEGTTSLSEATEEIKTATHRYAKRQRTWFRRDKRIKWISVDKYGKGDLTKRAIDLIEAH